MRCAFENSMSCTAAVNGHFLGQGTIMCALMPLLRHYLATWICARATCSPFNLYTSDHDCKGRLFGSTRREYTTACMHDGMSDSAYAGQ